MYEYKVIFADNSAEEMESRLNEMAHSGYVVKFCYHSNHNGRPVLILERSSQFQGRLMTKSELAADNRRRRG